MNRLTREEAVKRALTKRLERFAADDVKPDDEAIERIKEEIVAELMRLDDLWGEPS